MSKRDAHIEVIARGVLNCGRWLLACRNLKGGYYYLPGGHVEFGESAAAALAREMEEEAGLKVMIGPLFLGTEEVFRTGKREHHEINLVFHVKQSRAWRAWHSTPPPPVLSIEKHIGFEWLDIGDLGTVDLRPTNLRDWLESWQAAGRPIRRSTWNTAIDARKYRSLRH